ncbi:MAG: 6-phosphofructokinase [Planctomycetaceae bacterium]|jgi:phosphofructokinase-like protein|nr:6-phosphofructokinase [Planctomycetaceae bacterium]
MSPSTKRLGILTGGGDCPGLNAVIRAVAKTAILQYGIEVIGIEDGFQGLIEHRVRPLGVKDVSGILTRGGTVLGTNNKANPARYCTGRLPNGDPIWEDVTDKCLATLTEERIDALIVIGGDGTMACAAPIAAAGFNVIGVPKTIDNDLVGTEITFGFLTAVATATEALDRLHSTADSHHRAMVCEVMGRNAGWIALTAGVASGSDVILIPEIPFDLRKVAEDIERRMRGPGFAIIVVAEGARPLHGQQVVGRFDPTSPDPIRFGGIGNLVATEIQDLTGVETRTTVLGHTQRGGTPISPDRILATNFGFHAMSVLASGKRNRLVVRENNIFTDIDLFATVGKQRLVPIDHPLIAAARAIGTSFGDGAGSIVAKPMPTALV